MSIFNVVKNRKIVSEKRDHPELGPLTVTLRFDDDCNNGRNSFAVTAAGNNVGGRLHEEIAEIFPEYEPLIKWHLTSTDGPMHYIANTMYWAKEGNLDYARNSAVAPNASMDELSSEEWLTARLPNLLVEFQEAMEGTFGGDNAQ